MQFCICVHLATKWEWSTVADTLFLQSQNATSKPFQQQSRIRVSDSLRPYKAGLSLPGGTGWGTGGRTPADWSALPSETQMSQGQLWSPKRCVWWGEVSGVCVCEVGGGVSICVWEVSGVCVCVWEVGREGVIGTKGVCEREVDECHVIVKYTCILDLHSGWEIFHLQSNYSNKLNNFILASEFYEVH